MRQCPRWKPSEQPLLLPWCLAVQLNKQLPAAITIFNPTGERLAFKVRLKLLLLCIASWWLGCLFSQLWLCGPAGQDHHPQEVCCAAQLGKCAATAAEGRRRAQHNTRTVPNISCSPPVVLCRASSTARALPTCRSSCRCVHASTRVLGQKQPGTEQTAWTLLQQLTRHPLPFSPSCRPRRRSQQTCHSARTSSWCRSRAWRQERYAIRRQAWGRVMAHLCIRLSGSRAAGPHTSN